MMLMQLSLFERLYLRFQSSDVSFEIIALNVITPLTHLPFDKALLSTMFYRIVRQAIKIKKGT